MTADYGRGHTQAIRAEELGGNNRVWRPPSPKLRTTLDGH
jgi:hypothetical protein